MPGSEHGPSIKNPKVYEALRRKGMSKSQAAAISNAMVEDALKDRNLPLEVKIMPAAAKAIWRAAFKTAIKEEPDQLAALLALRAVQKEFKRIENEEGEEEWVSREEAEQKELEALAEEVGGMAEAAEMLGSGDPEEKGKEGESGGSKGGGSEGDDNDDEPSEYSKTTKTTETTETSSGGKRRKEAAAEGEGESESESTGDSVELIDTLLLDAGKFRLTNDGYLVAKPRVSRTGIQLYKGFEVGRPEMDVVRVYRPENEVFSHAAMTSLAHKPITLEHPDSNVNAANWREHAVGKVESDVARDGDFIRVPLMLMDAQAIAAVQGGKSQLSVGYGARIVWGDGKTPAGEPYDAMQTQIRANHIAIVSSARGGEKLKIGDGCEDQHHAYFDREFSQAEREKAAEKGQAMPHGGFPIKSGGDLRNAIRAVGRAKNPGAAKTHIKKRASALGLTKLIPANWGDSEGNHGGQQRRQAMTERLLDGVTIELEDKDGQILDRFLSTTNQKLRDAGADVEGLKKQIAQLQAQLAAAQQGDSAKDGEIVALKAKVEDSKLTPEKLDKALNLRMEVVDRATTYFGDAQKYAWQGKSDMQIRRDVVAARLGDQKAKAMDDAMIEGAFLSITEPEQQDGFSRMTQSFSGRPASGNYSDAAAKAYDKRNSDLSARWQRNKTKTA